jgi:hypothetical protein
MAKTRSKTAHSVTLSDLTAVALLIKWFPLELVDKAVEQAGSVTFRLRSLPVELMFYFCLVMSFHKDFSASEILRIVLEGTDRVYGKQGGKIPTRSAICHAREKLGAEPLKLMFDWVCKPLAQPRSEGCFFRDLLKVVIDGCYLNVADTAKNSAAFGRSSNQHEKASAYPQMKMVCLAEAGTHAIFGMVTGKYADSELTLAEKLICKLTPEMLCIVDRLYFGYRFWKLASKTGARLLWRLKSDIKVEPRTSLPDGSYIASYFPSIRDKENKGEPPIEVRVIDYVVTNAKTKKKETIRLATNMLDLADGSAEELARLYMQRWEIELTYGEIKVRLNQNQICLRSGTPDLVEQELYGLILAHYAVRSAIYEAAGTGKRMPDDPDDFSFVGTVRIMRRKMLSSGGFSP